MCFHRAILCSMIKSIFYFIFHHGEELVVRLLENCSFPVWNQRNRVNSRRAYGFTATTPEQSSVKHFRIISAGNPHYNYTCITSVEWYVTVCVRCVFKCAFDIRLHVFERTHTHTHSELSLQTFKNATVINGCIRSDLFGVWCCEQYFGRTDCAKLFLLCGF